MGGYRHAGQFGHAHRRGVYQPACGAHGGGQVFARVGAVPLEVLIQVVGQGLSAIAVDIKNFQTLYAFTEQRVSHRRACAPGPHLDDTLQFSTAQPTSKAFCKPQAVRVVPDALAVLEHHGVDRTDAVRLG